MNIRPPRWHSLAEKSDIMRQSRGTYAHVGILAATLADRVLPPGHLFSIKLSVKNFPRSLLEYVIQL